jgi:hypothetical protein
MPWGTGIMECWNTGFGGMRSAFNLDDTDQKLKIRTSSAYYTQYSIFPAFHYSIDHLAANTTPLR